MRTKALMMLVAFILLSSSQVAAQETNAIQLAAYSSWDQLMKNEDQFNAQLQQVEWPGVMYDEQNVYTQVGAKLIKVYLLHYGSEEGKLLAALRKTDYFKGAFNKQALNITNLRNYRMAIDERTNIPTEYTAKGGEVPAESTTEEEVMYRIQLGVFMARKSVQDLAQSYGLSEANPSVLANKLTYDFVKVNGKVCRRYFYGTYSNKAQAEAMMRYLEKESNRELAVVEIP